MNGAIVGRGRMGRVLGDVLIERGHRVHALIGKGDGLETVRGADVAFEFTHPEAAERNVRALLEYGIPTICGTTGWNPEGTIELSHQLQVPLMVAPNFSIGVAVVTAVAREAARHLAEFPEFEAGIFERHHSKKADATSGTAFLLGAAIAESGRKGSKVPVASLRQGGCPGDHHVYFEGPDETIEITHRARSRRIFAVGAVCAAEWMVAEGAHGPVTFEDFVERRNS